MKEQVRVLSIILTAFSLTACNDSEEPIQLIAPDEPSASDRFKREPRKPKNRNDGASERVRVLCDGNFESLKLMNTKLPSDRLGKSFSLGKTQTMSYPLVVTAEGNTVEAIGYWADEKQRKNNIVEIRKYEIDGFYRELKMKTIAQTSGFLSKWIGQFRIPLRRFGLIDGRAILPIQNSETGVSAYSLRNRTIDLDPRVFTNPRELDSTDRIAFDFLEKGKGIRQAIYSLTDETLETLSKNHPENRYDDYDLDLKIIADGSALWLRIERRAANFILETPAGDRHTLNLREVFVHEDRYVSPRFSVSEAKGELVLRFISENSAYELYTDRNLNLRKTNSIPFKGMSRFGNPQNLGFSWSADELLVARGSKLYSWNRTSWKQVGMSSCNFPTFFVSE